MRLTSQNRTPTRTPASTQRVARAWLRSPTPVALQALSVLDLALRLLADSDDLAP
jgi:hypothetical protein